jgi:peptidoglycan/xylan/chitin deacetylase (PgdA/CDA1 family)
MRAATTGLLAAGGIAWSGPALAPVVPAVSSMLRIPRTRIGPEPVVCLTFDDGPHFEGTPAVLDALAAAGATASFFLVGEQVLRAPALAAEIAAAGHCIGLHGFRHRNQLRLSPGAINEDMRRGTEAIASVVGSAPAVYRPPYGIFSAAGLALAHRRGFAPLLWSKWGRDWRRRTTPVEIAAKATAGLRAGDVVLLHDSDAYSAPGSWRRTADALPRVLDEAGMRGLGTAGI